MRISIETFMFLFSWWEKGTVLTSLPESLKSLCWILCKRRSSVFYGIKTAQTVLRVFCVACVL